MVVRWCGGVVVGWCGGGGSLAVWFQSDAKAVRWCGGVVAVVVVASLGPGLLCKDDIYVALRFRV